jgi:hypothetical protein
VAAAAATRTSAGQRGDQDRLDCVQPVLGLVEDDGALLFEDGVGDLGVVGPYLSCSPWPRTVLRSCTVGRQTDEKTMIPNGPW